MASETRVIRPYSGVGRAESAFSHVELEFGGKRLQDGDTAYFLQSEFRESVADLLFPVESAGSKFAEELTVAIDEMSLSTADVDMRVIVSSSFLRISEVCWSFPCGRLSRLPDRITLTAPERPAALSAIHHGADVELQLVLNKQLANGPGLKPWRKGTWLSRSQFRLRTTGSWASFSPLELSDEVREGFNLPVGVVKFVEVKTAALLEQGPDIADVVTLYLDPDVLSHLQMHRGSASVELFQRQLFIDVLGAIVFELTSTGLLNDVDIEQVRGTVVGRILASFVQSSRQADLLEVLRDEPRAFLAHVEVRADIRNGLMKSFEV